MITNLNNIINYLKNPEYLPLQNISIKDKFIVVLKTLALSLIICLSLAILIGLVAQFGLVDMEKHSSKELMEKYSKLVVFLLVTLAAPIIEEVIFRAPLSSFRNYKKSFKYIFYGFAILFGYIHIYNYEITAYTLLLSPILVAPQIVLGLFLGYLRVKLGLIYSMLLHALYNGFLTLPMLLFGDLINT